ncbi:hypothetical protein Tsubulata_007573 [Turnera subulata]|uniref:Phosphatidate cytidylyltransferase, mitochondrial n=1 Tax=Turnera subulata TaxID=218843 RepID=A0A9Q0J7R3_9ROSI|nr:hypothetical protein Tsubulata_007573 [Turnera subulata]
MALRETRPLVAPDAVGTMDDDEKKSELKSFLHVLPPVEFCCVYGSSLHPNNQDKITFSAFGIPINGTLRHHYSSWMANLGGPRLITGLADNIGVGVHFNPFVSWNNKVHILVDNLGVGSMNSMNLRAAVSAALLLLPSKFGEEELYCKICSLSYMGDLRMLFAEDKDKVKKIVQGQFGLFKSMYRPFLQEYKAKDILSFSSSSDHHANIYQDCGLPATRSLVLSLPQVVRSKMGMSFGGEKVPSDTGRVLQEGMVNSREVAARSVQKVIRRTVRVSSARQAISGLVATGGINAAMYLGNKVRKAWNSWTR